MSLERNEIGRAALLTAICILVMAALSPFAFFYVFPKLIVRGQIEATVANIRARENLFLIGLGCYLVTFIADIVVSLSLHVLLKPVDAFLSSLAACFRLVYAALAIAAIEKLAAVFRATRAFDDARPFHASLEMMLASFRYEWSFSLTFFAIHLALIAALVLRWQAVPKLLGVLLAINAAGYLVDSARPYLFPSAALPYLPAAFFGELIFMAWLFARWRRLGESGGSRSQGR